MLIDRRRLMMNPIGGGIDLSMVDNEGNDRASMTTANCYMVHEAGKYMLPLVYGNAIVDGAVNTQAFCPSSTANEKILTPFINHNGDGITGPWLTKNGSGVDAGMGLTASSAEIVWYTSRGSITKVGIKKDYLTFTVGSSNPANALLAVKDSNGTILWTWHIWITPETYTDTTTITPDNLASRGVAPVPLGWMPTDTSNRKGSGRTMTYQHGRMTPMMDNNNVSEPRPNDSSALLVQKTYTTTGTNANFGTIENCIKYPIYKYGNGITGDTRGSCIIADYQNLWNAAVTATKSIFGGWNITTRGFHTVKTIYDPCPPGFCVPTERLLYKLAHSSSTWVNTTYKGRLFLNSIWAYAAGYRNWDDEYPDGVNTYGRYWASVKDDSNSNCLVADQSNYKTAWGNKGSTFSILPVTEN